MGSSKLHHVFTETSPTPHHLAKLWMKLGLSRNPTLAPEAAAKSIFIQLPQMSCLHWGTFPVTQKLHSKEQSEHSSTLLPVPRPSSQPSPSSRQSCALLLHIHGWEMSRLICRASLLLSCPFPPSCLNTQLYTVLPPQNPVLCELLGSAQHSGWTSLGGLHWGQ